MVLTILIFAFSVFLLGFVADPIINMYFDPVSTIASIPSAGRDAFQDIYLLDEDEDPSGWIEHFIKGLTSLGMIGVLKTVIAMGPWNWYYSFRMSGGTRPGTTGRDRFSSLTWVAVIFGIVTFLFVSFSKNHYLRSWF